LLLPPLLFSLGIIAIFEKFFKLKPNFQKIVDALNYNQRLKGTLLEDHPNVTERETRVV
jgi:hypothetical protein